ncbi:hypothetical protein [Pseudidiomarina terrestris]|uniref:hypothetical protein n=1 Tax=Pseudidiomarina terrestris TaxID=2820060 RepID=UPI0026520923|nr:MULTISPECIES: hypothetical protein [unclassified Pseudidiomarina]MDN7135893.1 hypothetical protein [Pseudidiomarina sp. 1ASP75-5]MEA3588058.1 hypothetical protein [Pseudidiomarina sp. 1APP75-27a]
MIKLFGLGSVVGCITLAALWAPNANAQEISQQQLRNCAAIENPLQRLVCYDKLAAGEALPATTQGSASGSQNAGNVEAEFGREHLDDPTSDRPDKILVKIADAQRNFFGKWEILLTNGQRWEQTDSRTVPLPDDADYYIERGVLNSFFLGRVGDEARRIRVRRVEE